MRKSSFILTCAIFAVLAFLLTGCASTRYVPEEAYLLEKNTIEVVDSKEISTSALNNYLRQKPNTKVVFGWKFLLSLYNASPKSDSRWSHFIKQMGEPPVIYDSTLLQRSVSNIDNYLNTLGYYNNFISTQVNKVDKKAQIHYRVKLGQKYRIDSLETDIKDSLWQSIYIAQQENSLVKKGDYLVPKVLDDEASRLNTLFRQNGYYDFSKNDIHFLADTLKHDGTASLTLQMDSTQANTPYFIRNIIIYPQFDPIQAALDSSYYASMDSLKYHGMTFFYHQKPMVRPRALSQLNLISKGNLYNESEVKATYNRYSSLRTYNGITLLFDKVAPDSLDYTIRLTPGNNQGYKINLEASSNSNGLVGVSPALSYFHKNIFRGGEWLTISLMGNFQFKMNDPIRSTELGASMTLSFPKMLFPVSQRIFQHIPRTDISSSYNLQSRPEYIRNIGSFSFGYTWRMGDKFYYTVNPLKFNLVKLFNMNPTFLESLRDPFLLNTYRDHFDLGLSTSIYYTSDATVPHKKNYFYIRSSFESAGNFLSAFNSLMEKDSTDAHTIGKIAYSQYVKLDVNTAYTWVFAPHHQVAVHFYGGVGLPYGNAKALPLEQRFYSGGANSLRAWQARTVGPGSQPMDSTFTIPNQAGDIKLEANIEYRFPLFWKMEGALFADAGNIWALNDFKDFYKSIAVDAGLGLRLNMDFVLLRLDMGMVLRDPIDRRWLNPNQWLKKNTYSFQFGVGYPF